MTLTTTAATSTADAAPCTPLAQIVPRAAQERIIRNISPLLAPSPNSYVCAATTIASRTVHFLVHPGIGESRRIPPFDSTLHLTVALLPLTLTLSLLFAYAHAFILACDYLKRCSIVERMLSFGRQSMLGYLIPIYQHNCFSVPSMLLQNCAANVTFTKM
jgi:hypothetical protein